MVLKLYEEAHRVVLQNGTHAIAIDRSSKQISATKDIPVGPGEALNGVLGLIDFAYSSHLVVVTAAKQRSTLAGAPVYQVSQSKLVPVSGQGDSRDQAFVDLLLAHLAQATLFYSPVYDLTSSTQRTAQLRASGKPSVDDRFFWNFELSRPFFSFPEFLFPVIYGVFSSAQININAIAVEFAVVSRRSRFRAGTRYFRRGIDADGHVANFNETEQILVVDDRIFSFLQTRGSVPGYWSEINNLKYKPKLQIGSVEQSAIDAKKHFAEQEDLYGEQILVNLVNQQGYERPVKQLYEDVVSKLNDPHLHYVYFDFHHECSKMRWHRVQLLVEELLSLGFEKFGWFEAQAGQPVEYQRGVVRTNCMDCLDRTNVVQSTLALYALERQLKAAGVLSDGNKLSADKQFMAKFRNIWADNADGVSCAYSGTGALKTDFTRAGTRTKLGAMQDLRNSIVRYVRNNFRDGPRQDGFSLFLREYVPNRDHWPLGAQRSAGLQSVPYLAAFCAMAAVLSVIYPSEKHTAKFNAYVTVVLALVSFTSFKFMSAHGMQYVSWPKLSSVNFVAWSPRRGYHIERNKHE